MPELDLSNAPSTLFLYGLAGSGKSYIGDLIAEMAGWRVYHADDDLTDEMYLALAECRPFTPAMRDRYFAIVVEKIRELQVRGGKLVVTQGVYKRRHRALLLHSLADMEMICVSADDTVIAARLSARDELANVNVNAAAALRADFEGPVSGERCLFNNSGASQLVGQLNAYYAAS